MTPFSRSLLRWGGCLTLVLPVFLLIASHFLQAKTQGLQPTGFLQDDMPYYMALARESFDTGEFHLTYGNPFSPNPETRRHFFQPLILGFGILLKLTGADPGFLFAGITALLALLTVRVSLHFYERWIQPIDSVPVALGFIVLLWGGGFLSFLGLLFSLSHGDGLQDLFLFDPSGGWWLLNFGRNLIFPTEAFYHLLALLLLLALRQRQWNTGLLLLALLSMSHPFTGIQFLLITTLWLTIEHFYVKARNLSRAIPLASGGLLVLHCAYYLVFLKSDPEQASLMRDWELPLVMHPETMIGAWGFAGIFVFLEFRGRWSELISTPERRLLLTVFGVTAALVNHDLILKPVQPLHFDRGYSYLALFLLGAPALLRFLKEKCEARKLIPIGLLLLCLLSDNLLWFGWKSTHPTGAFLNSETREILNVLRDQGTSKDRLVSEDSTIAYLAMTYTPVRTWYAHWWFTPYGNQRKVEAHYFFETGQMPPEWTESPLLILCTPSKEIQGTVLFQNQQWKLIRVK